ncbi:MAG: hypothetical protein JWM86_2018 [Thermoleophilia bacterium]|nr:hypothetical protein [Thermoleophilia bacterium]
MIGAPQALLLDADGTLFPSEEPAFDASAVVVNEFAREIGFPGSFTGDGLRRAATGRNFRSISRELFERTSGAETAPDFDAWIEREREVVTQHLAKILEPDPEVQSALDELGAGMHLAVVSSSARARIDATLEATDLARRIDPSLRFSAEDSLPEPRSKPDPAVYENALSVMSLVPSAAVALEDSVPGVLSAAASGIDVIGIVAFVAEQERPDRVRELRAAGATEVVERWSDLPAVIAGRS